VGERLRSASFSVYTKFDDLLSWNLGHLWCEWRRSSATTAWKKFSLKKAPQSHETELWLWRRRARKKEKKGSLTIYEGKSQVQEEGGRKKRRKGMVLNWLHKASKKIHEKKWSSIGVPLSQIFFILYLWNCSPSSGKSKSFRWRKSVKEHFPETFSKKEHPQKDLNLGYLPDSNKRMRGSKKNCLVETDPIHISEIKGQRPDSVKILWNTLPLFLDDMLTSKEKNEENSKRTEIYHQRTSQQSKKEKGKARKEQRKELSQHQKEQSREKKQGWYVQRKKTSLPSEWMNEPINWWSVHLLFIVYDGRSSHCTWDAYFVVGQDKQSLHHLGPRSTCHWKYTFLFGHQQLGSI